MNPIRGHWNCYGRGKDEEIFDTQGREYTKQKQSRREALATYFNE